MKLYSPEGHHKTNRILAVGLCSGIPVELVPASFNNSPSKEFLKKCPHGKLPALQTKEGFLFGAATIIRYLTDISVTTLKVQDVHLQILVDQWIDFSEAEIDQHAGVLYLQVFGLVPFQQDKWDNSKKELMGSIKFLDSTLKSKTYLAGDRLTTGDLSVAGVLHVAFKLLLDLKIRGQYPHVSRWFTHICSLPCFVESFGITHLCEQQFNFHKNN